MGYNRENISKVKSELAKRRENAIEEAKTRLLEVHESHPDIKNIDGELSRTGLLVMDEIAKGKENLEERIDRIRLDNLELQAQKRELLVRYGYGENYLDIKYTCPICSDTGTNGSKMCSCMKKMLVYEGMKSAGIDKLFETQKFETFSLDFYSYDREAYNLMRHYFDMCCRYATRFNESTSECLLLSGNTGLGKTHLSTSIAAVVIEKGFDVCYSSAQNILSDFEADRFGRSGGAGENDTHRYFDCDLLIIDDLGSESITQFTVSCIYNIVNTRIVKGRPIIINTNLSQGEMRSKYTDRIASRLFGEFTPMRFQGKDIRFLKT